MSINFPLGLPDPPTYYRGPAGWEHQYVTTTDTSSIIRAMIGAEQQDGESMNKDYEVTFNDGTTEYLERIRAVNIGGIFIAFQRANANGTMETVKAFRNDAVLAYRPLPPSEEIVRPKYTFLVTLRNNGGTKTVQADLFKVSAFGEEKVYEFFSKTTEGTAREELSIPFENVLMVERVDGAGEDVAVVAQAARVDDLPTPEPMDYDQVVRPKRKI